MNPCGETRKPLTTIAQEAVAIVLFDGARAIDATMGNGHDTVFLAHRVGATGQVIAFDIQPAALAATTRRVAQAGLGARVDLRQLGHEHLHDALPADWRNGINAAMFNLGYLPGSDKACVTVAKTTCQALDQAINLLLPNGRLSVLLYRDHDGAAPEAGAVKNWIDTLPERYQLDVYESPGPVLYLVTRSH